MAAAAIVLALVAGIGVYVYASGADKRAAGERVVRRRATSPTSDIAKGTTGAEVLQAGLVRPGEGRQGLGAAVDRSPTSNDLVGKVAAGPIDTKQFITAGSFVSAEDGVGGRVRHRDRERRTSSRSR